MLQLDAVRKQKFDSMHALRILANQLIPFYTVSSLILKFVAMIGKILNIKKGWCPLVWT
jgi:membrane protein YqaA with SNARE-associated domain